MDQDELLASVDSELLLHLGRELVGEGFSEKLKEQLVARAKAILKANWSMIADRICQTPLIRSSSEVANSVSTIALIVELSKQLDAFATEHKVNAVTMGVVAASLVLKGLCATRSQAPPK